MVSKELRKLSRKELVDIIYQMKKNEEKKQEEMDALEASLQEKRIRVDVAGSIAEAAMDITQIFATAQRTADLYLHEISYMKESTQQQCAAMIAEATQQVEELQSLYARDYEKWQRLKEEIQQLEQMKAFY